MLSGINAALSALQAYGKKMQVNANNVANMNTDGFKKSRVVLNETPPQGVRGQPEQVEDGAPVVYEQIGQQLVAVEKSNVDLGEEIPDMMVNQMNYKANLKTLQTQDEMLGTLLDIKT
jgi:flagellar hook protein FlgE